MNVVLEHRPQSVPQQPDWTGDPVLRRVREDLTDRAALVAAADVRRLRSLLARAATGEYQIIQAGDCAEDPAESSAAHVARKAGLIDTLAGIMKMRTGRPVLRVGRMAGQFAKPRSRPTELVDGRELPAYRGHLINRPEPDPLRRRPDPRHLLTCYQAASEVMAHLGWLNPAVRSIICPPTWTSHEALVLDYERPLLRSDEDGRSLLASTHWPWIGERTRQLDGAHVGLLAGVVNPVACKVGPTMSADEVVALCELLDPGRDAGRLSLVARMGTAAVREVLPGLVRAVRDAGHPVVWLTDPMHGNTYQAADGFKRRHVADVIAEVEGFQEAVRAGGGVAGGLHLETTPDDVTECVEDRAVPAGGRYTSLCDPRLNPSQAIAVVHAWR